LSIINPSELDLLEESVIKINRTAKVTSRGKRFRFSALVAVGDGRGHIGIGLGKAKEVIMCIQKGKEIAKRNMFRIPIINGTIPHKIIGKHGASKVMLKPASPGTGIIAAGSVRAMMEQVGIHNILTKRYGSKNSMNLVYATLHGLLNLKDAVAIANKRGITIKEVFN
jgi:small subunit ribosomal protein S5